MHFNEFLQFIEREDGRLRERFGEFPDLKMRILARTVKISEEVGELCEQVLSANAMQRTEKTKASNRESLSDEFADVVITTFLLAKTMDVDMVDALRKKILKINGRYEQRDAS